MRKRRLEVTRTALVREEIWDLGKTKGAEETDYICISNDTLLNIKRQNVYIIWKSDYSHIFFKCRESSIRFNFFYQLNSFYNGQISNIIFF